VCKVDNYILWRNTTASAWECEFTEIARFQKFKQTNIYKKRIGQSNLNINT